jgi:transcriptional regulator with XRE-family HTH domain
MNQPELGKKIADLRKSKGFTQEELVEKCNLNIRTIQRIESGEVTPRIYTLKMIFAALDYNSADLFEIRNSGFSIPIWPEQYYRYVLDLFNLKTNKMKKITILSITFSAIIFGLFLISRKSQAQEKIKSDLQVSNDNSSNQTLKDNMVFSYYSCTESFDEKDEKIARDVEFEIDGVKLNVSLIKLNRLNREFNAGFVKGKLLQNKVEVVCGKGMIYDLSIKYRADNIEKSGDNILLKGNAKLTYQNESIETNEIIVTVR